MFPIKYCPLQSDQILLNYSWCVDCVGGSCELCAYLKGVDEWYSNKVKKYTKIVLVIIAQKECEIELNFLQIS